MDMKKFEKDMTVFSPGKHQDVLTYLSHLKAMGWTIEDTETWVVKQKEKIKDQIKIKNISYKCPECNVGMRSYPVNVNPATQTGDPTDKSVLVCSNPKCRHTVYNK